MQQYEMHKEIPLTAETIKLDYPYTTAAGKHLTEVIMRRARVRDLLRASKDDSAAETEVKIMSSLLGMVREDLIDMDAADYKKIQDAYVRQMGESNKSPE